VLIYVVHNPESVFNRSIWQGYLNAFQALGHDAFAVPQNDLPHPKDIAQVPDLLFVVHGDQHLLQRVKLYKSLPLIHIHLLCIMVITPGS